MKAGVSYKQQPVNGEYDVIVIGSGMGGLATAGLLARKGKRVLVLERHYTAGGFTHMFKRNDYEWDVGIHYIGEVHQPKTVLARIFDYLSDGNLKWADMGEVYDRIRFGDKEYHFVKGKENFRNQLKEYFPAPEDQKAIDQYIHAVDTSVKLGTGYFIEKALPKIASFFAGGYLRKPFLKFSDRTTLETLRSFTNNEELIGVLCGQYGDYGLAPADSSFAIHAMVAKHYFNGGSYPVGGSSNIAATFEPGIEKAGGKIYTNAEVTEILVKDNKAIGVKMKDGKEIFAETIISDAGIVNTFGKLLPTEVVEKHNLVKQLQQVNPSAAHVSLYIGLKHTAEELGLKKGNYWIYPNNYNHDEVFQSYLKDENADLPVVYISFPSAKDPDFTNRYPGKATIEIITVAPYERFEQWENGRWKKRGEDYEAYKEKISQRLLEYLYHVEPQVKGKIDFYELSSPLTTKHFVNYGKGEIYGLDHTPERFRLRFLKPQTPVKNLYLTGQDVVTAGIGGALFGGILTVSAMYGKNIMGDILKK